MEPNKDVLNQEAIDGRRISFEDAEIKVTKHGVWQCHFCVKRFVNETVFMRHFCEQKKRALEVTSPIGTAAFSYFNIWMKARKFKEQSIDAFVGSKYYRSILKFAQMVIAAGISNPEQYVKLMVEADSITPDLWCRDACYRLYLTWMDEVDNPLSQVQASIECLISLAEKEGVDYREVIGHIGPQRVLELITQRKLSPWFLLHSTAAQQLLKSLDKELLKSFDRAINIGAWINKLEEQQQMRTEIRHIISELGL